MPKKKLPFYHAFAIGDPTEDPENECPSCRADISYGVTQQLQVRKEHGRYVPTNRGGEFLNFCRKCAGIISSRREPNGRLINKEAPAGVLVVK